MKKKKKYQKRNLIVLGMILTRKGGKMKRRSPREDWRKEIENE